MARLNAAQQQVKTEFLRQMQDGRLDRAVEDGSALPNLAWLDDPVTVPATPGVYVSAPSRNPAACP